MCDGGGAGRGSNFGDSPQKVKFCGFSIFSKFGPTIFPKLRQTVVIGVPLTHKKFWKNLLTEFRENGV